jgi:hypothetical protein
MIVAAHVATGALAGRLAGSRLGAVALGVVLHGVGDSVPHEDFGRRFELVTGAAGILLLAARHGPLAPVTVGAVASSIPDVEHVLPLPRPGGRKLYPTHRFASWHREGGIPAWVQLAAATAILLALTRRR